VSKLQKQKSELVEVGELAKGFLHRLPCFVRRLILVPDTNQLGLGLFEFTILSGRRVSGSDCLLFRTIFVLEGGGGEL
jgi:hypothetical protein